MVGYYLEEPAEDLRKMLELPNDADGEEFLVFYAKNPSFKADPEMTHITLERTHTFVVKLNVSSVERVFYTMQGEVWSEGKNQRIAQSLIRRLGLQHTSMSVGDVAISFPRRKMFICDMRGWIEKDLKLGLDR